MKAHADAAKQLGALLLMAVLAGCESGAAPDPEVENTSLYRDRCDALCAAVGRDVVWFSPNYVSTGLACACAGRKP